jgi:hypothetical protein
VAKRTTGQRKATTQRTGARVWRKGFIAALSLNGNITDACEQMGIERSTAYRLRAEDEAFAAEWDTALESAADRLEAEAWRRAVDGVEEPVFQQKEMIGTIRKYSDTLLVTLLKAHKKDKYSDKSTIDHNVDLTKLSDEDLNKLIRGGKL